MSVTVGRRSGPDGTGPTIRLARVRRPQTHPWMSQHISTVPQLPREAEPSNDLECGLATVEDWIVDGLPQWNNELLAGRASIDAFAEELRGRLRPILRIPLLDLARA